MPDEWRGFSFETLALGELRAFKSYRRKDKRLFHYSVTGAFDIDFVVDTQKKVLNRPARFVAIEAKASSQWRSEWHWPLAMIAEHGAIDAAYGVYLGKKDDREPCGHCLAVRRVQSPSVGWRYFLKTSAAPPDSPSLARGQAAEGVVHMMNVPLRGDCLQSLGARRTVAAQPAGLAEKLLEV